jgi:hypothetical protein
MIHYYKQRVLAMLGIILVFSMPAAAASAPIGTVRPKTDFNGDGKADLFLQNVFTGGLSAWFTNGGQVLQQVSYGTVAPSTGWTTIGAKDVNGDNRTDLFWYNVNTGGVSAWFMNGSTVLQTVSYGTVSPLQGWIPAGLADFNNDGRADLLWYNKYTGGVTAWLLSGSSILQIASYGTVALTSGWMPIGVKDANGDGCADLFLYNSSTGGISILFIKAGSVLANVSLGALTPSTGWVPTALDDFNGDGRADLLWYNIYTGAVGSWLINGGAILQVGSYGTLLRNTGWILISTKDVSGDGRADLLWYNVYSGGMSAWLINGGSFSQGVSYGALDPKLGWSPIGLDDFNGDGRIDLFWYNIFTNATTAWLLNGAGILQVANYSSVPASSVWQVKIPRD